MCESSKFIFVVPIQCVPFVAADDLATWITPVILKDGVLREGSLFIERTGSCNLKQTCLFFPKPVLNFKQFFNTRQRFLKKLQDPGGVMSPSDVNTTLLEVLLGCFML